MKYKFLSHTADIKFQAFGKTIEECFTNSFFALKEVIFENLKIKSVIKKKIIVGGKDYESLLYNFLEEFLYLLDAENFLCSKILRIKINKKSMGLKPEVFFKPQICINRTDVRWIKPNLSNKKEYSLNADIIGDNGKNYKFSNSVKAITYNDMFIKQEKDKFIAQVVVDV